MIGTGNRTGMFAESERLSDRCSALGGNLLAGRQLIIASNRGPVTFSREENGKFSLERGGGGLVTALLGLSRQQKGVWISSALSDGDRQFLEGDLDQGGDSQPLRLRFVDPEPESYHGYYNVIANPLLWFLQHSMWDLATSPTFTSETWKAWQDGYVAVNWLFAEAIADEIIASKQPPLVMVQDYHLYLAPGMIRKIVGNRRYYSLTHFIHIPWPGPEDWGILPAEMREAILRGLCAVDLLGFQTKNDALNFIRTCETLLPGARVNYRRGRIWLDRHVTHVRDFPISIDVEALREQAASEETRLFRAQIGEMAGKQQLIVRVDRTEPSKNIVRGFQAYEELLEQYPEHREKVLFLAILVPSRLEVEEYQNYLDELMAAAGRVNARYGGSNWEPVRVLVGESYPRALAALQLYDVLLVNPIADGMNLVCKEGAVVNDRAGVIVLSERAGAHQQLGGPALVISPCDVYDTARALHRALEMPAGERRKRAAQLRESIERDDIARWICWQVDAIERLQL